MNRSLPLILAAMAAASVRPCVGDELRRNPFDRPDIETEARLLAPGGVMVSEEALTVSAILVAGDRSLVNVNGTILGIGEERNGYVLRAVSEEAAEFSRDGKTITISLYEQQNNEDGD